MSLVSIEQVPTEAVGETIWLRSRNAWFNSTGGRQFLQCPSKLLVKHLVYEAGVRGSIPRTGASNCTCMVRLGMS